MKNCSKNRRMLSAFGGMAAVVVIWAISVPPAWPAEMTDAEKEEKIRKLYASYRKEFPDAPEISPAEARKRMALNAIVFVDTRMPEEMRVSMLPGAVSQAEFLKEPDGFAGKTIAAYCTVGYRSGVFAKEMAEKGVEIRNLACGLLGWVLEGGKVYHAGKETRRIHVYGNDWNYPPEDYTSVTFRFWDRIWKK